MSHICHYIRKINNCVFGPSSDSKYYILLSHALFNKHFIIVLIFYIGTLHSNTKFAKHQSTKKIIYIIGYKKKI